MNALEFQLGPLWFMARRSIGFFRIFGYGLHWKDTRREMLLWSDRSRIYRQWRLGAWLVTPLKRGARGWYR